jgi:hypothetical protein
VRSLARSRQSATTRLWRTLRTTQHLAASPPPRSAESSAYQASLQQQTK